MEPPRLSSGFATKPKKQVKEQSERMKTYFKECRAYLLLWSTQSLSQLGSAMTSFALTLWVYEKTGSALQTALLSVCFYAPYVLGSIFAGALTDRWNKKAIMLSCDAIAACCTVVVLILLQAGRLEPMHMYGLNLLNGLMNTVQQPAGDVAMTLLIPTKYYQQTSGLRSFSQSLITILNPVLATLVFALWGLETVIALDLTTFAAAFAALGWGVRLPAQPLAPKQALRQTVRSGLAYLRARPLALTLIFFLAAVNLVASAFEAVLPALVLPRENGGEVALGLVNACAGVATLAGSVLVMLLPAPQNRVRVIYLTMLASLGVENFLLAFGRTPLVWCLAQFVGWLPVPVMQANLDVVLRTQIPLELQGRVYACRNTLQYFTIPVGLMAGGWMVDALCEPLMASAPAGEALSVLFGAGKGSGAALAMFGLGVFGVGVCLAFRSRLKRYWRGSQS